MSTDSPAKEKKPKPYGVLDRNRFYTTDACLKELGLGRNSIIEARKAGVKPMLVGRVNWYSGAELADWIQYGKVEARIDPLRGRADLGSSPGS